MLKTPASFPTPGSWALAERLGALVPARITDRPPGTFAAGISYPDEPTASGAHRATLDKLWDPTPLDDSELRELDELSAYLATLAQPQRSSRAARFDALRLRQVHAKHFLAEITKLNRFRLATPATREAQRVWEAGLAAAAGELARTAA
jgi:hypothetical protein